MKEIEVKVLNIDPEEIERKLAELGAKKIKNEHQVNLIFDTPGYRLHNDYRGYARIRIKRNLDDDAEKILLTVKKNVSSDGARQNIEHEVEIDSSEEMEKILGDLGYELKHRGEKHRISYSYDDILFEIDTWDKYTYPEPYLELEVKVEKDIERAAELLELNRENITSKSIQQLRREAGLED
ncbi:adenylate cyclase, class 2 [Dethiosulfatibacter aminovorans DSM 17477]|uniref:Adenylate cyclase, class 2 n=1 Tax=Dethiosulfatibacter aminovorans DSM 17477 TaxID=1121476 RepID=A0A1M6FBD7_9FIRM|nr:class IV adenylate cyclase [Dethiosulfatibacter aminovorans]SHI95058.1 adenylate cyclase, class 2 [Dethiosulfatibacter aminovorans DSM 17477]